MLFPNRLNSEKINHNIDFENSPFYVQLKADEWKVIPEDTNEMGLRRAGVSSFGVGGVNVHIVLEEYTGHLPQPLLTVSQPVMVPFSARSEEALKRNLEKFNEYISNSITNNSLPDIRDTAYTMQMGRIELPYRAAFLVCSYEELQTDIEMYINGEIDKDTEQSIFSGKAKSIIDYPENNLPLILDEKSITTEQLGEAAGKWIEGKKIDFSVFYHEYIPNRVSLPTYSFERERYWLYEQPEHYDEDVKEAAKPEQEMKDSDFIQMEELANDQDTSARDNAFIEELLEMPTSEKLEAMISYIQNIFADLLGFTEGRLPDIEQGFFEMGLESIETTKAYNRLTGIFELELDMQLFFNYPNIYKLSEYILELLEAQEENNVNEEGTIQEGGMITDNEFKNQEERGSEIVLSEEKERRVLQSSENQETLDDMDEDELAELLKGLLD